MDWVPTVTQFKAFPVTVRKPRTDLAIVAISGNLHSWEMPNGASGSKDDRPSLVVGTHPLS